MIFKGLLKTTILAAVLSLGLAVQSATAIPLPNLDYVGNAIFDGNILEVGTLANASATGVTTLATYQDFSTCVLCGTDSMVNAAVDFATGSLISMDLTTAVFNDGFFNIFGTNGDSMQATLTDITVEAVGATAQINTVFSANLQGVTWADSLSSQWLTEMNDAPEASTHITFTLQGAGGGIVLLDGSANNLNQYNVSGKVAPVPEPSTILLLGGGLLGLALARRKKTQA